MLYLENELLKWADFLPAATILGKLKVTFQTILSARLGFGTQPRYKAPGKPRIESKNSRSD